MRRKPEDGVKLTLDRLIEVLRYEPKTGRFFWKTTSNRRLEPGSEAGFKTSQGYRAITIDGKTYNCGRLAWFYVHKEWPANQIQHVNGDKTDSRLENIRLMGIKGKADRNISRERIFALLDYDPETGIFRWKISPSPRVHVGDEAGVINTLGYRYLSLDGAKFLAHRVAWYLTYDEWPESMIDHINGDRADNRLSNLRKANNGQNTRNSRRFRTNTSGYKGVSFHKSSKKWIARIVADYRVYPLGKFNTKEEAHAAYCEAAQRLHGIFARTS